MPIETIADLKPDPRNANKGTPRGHSIIERSLRQRGAGRSGLAAKDGTMIAGSQTLQEVADLGIPIRPIHTDGKEWVVVVRDDIESGSEEATLMAAEDNRAAQLGIQFDPIILADLSTQFDLSSLWTPEEWTTQLVEKTPASVVPPDEFQSYDESIETQYQCPKCRYEWSGKPK